MSIHFTARVRSDRNLADSSVVHCVSGLSCSSITAVPIKDLHCCVSRSSMTSAPSCKPLFIAFEPGATRAPFVCSVCSSNETNLTSQSQCVYRILSPEEVFNAPCHFSAHEFHCCQESRINTFTDSYPERFTHQLLKVVCSDT